MKDMKVLFIGIGSIAKRHINNLQVVAAERKMSCTIDAFRRTSSGSKPQGVNTVYCDINKVPNDYDVVFITNPTEKHLETLKTFHNIGKHFFIEKPLTSISQIDKANDFCLRKDSVYYVACPLRYNAVIQYIKNNINIKKVISVRSISSSYLPDWRPDQDYRETYSAHKNMGGGVSIDLIHEWDYLTYLFGWPNKVYSMMGKKSQLEIDSEDYAIYIADYEDKVIELHLDYFGRKTIREIELFTDEETILGDVASNRITFLKQGKTIDLNECRDDYQQRELKHFLDMITGECEVENGYIHGLSVLRLTQGIV